MILNKLIFQKENIVGWADKVSEIILKTKPEINSSPSIIKFNWYNCSFLNLDNFTVTTSFLPSKIKVKDRVINKYELSDEIDQQLFLNTYKEIVNIIGDPTSKINLSNMINYTWEIDNMVVSINLFKTNQLLIIISNIQQ